MIISIKTRVEAGPDMPINCPACKQLVEAPSVDNVETLKLFFIFPVYVHRTTFLNCSVCGAQLCTRFKVRQLLEVAPETLDESLWIRGGDPLSQGSSAFVRVLFVLAVLTVWIPWINLVFAGLVVYLNRHAHGWRKRVGYILLAVAIGLDLLLLTIIVLAGQR